MRHRTVWIGVILIIMTSVSLTAQGTGHSGAVNDTAWQPSGLRFATCGDDGKIIIWNSETMEPERSLEGHDGSVLSVDYSSDGRWLVSGGSDATVILWDGESGRRIRVFTGYTDYVRSVVFSADNTLIASGCDDGSVIVWDTETGAQTAYFLEHTDYVRSVDFHPDGVRVASGSDDGTVMIWNLDNQTREQVFRGHTDYVRSVRFSPDGRYVASGSDDQTVIVRDVEEGTVVQTIDAHSDYVRSVDFSSDSSLLISGGDDGFVRIWNWRQNSIDNEYRNHEDYVFTVDIGPNDRYILSGGSEGTFSIYDLRSRESVLTLQGGQSGVQTTSAIITCASFHPEETVFAAGTREGEILLYSNDDNSFTQRISSGVGAVGNIEFSPAGDIVALSGDSAEVRVFSYPGFEPVATLTDFTGYVLSLGFSSSGEYLVCGDSDGNLTCYNTDTFTFLSRASSGEEPVLALAFDPRQDLFAAAEGSDGAAVWDLPDLEMQYRLTDHAGMEITDIRYGAEGNMLFMSELDGAITQWNTGQRSAERSFTIDDTALYSIDVLSEAETFYILAGGESGTAWVVEPGKTGTPLMEFEVGSSIMETLFSPDYEVFLLITQSGQLVLYDAVNEKVVFDSDDTAIGEETAVEEAGVMVLTVDVSPDGEMIAAGGSDGKVSVWDFSRRADCGSATVIPTMYVPLLFIPMVSIWLRRAMTRR